MQPGLPGRSYRISDHIFGDGEFVCKRHALPTFERHILKSEYVLPRQAFTHHQLKYSYAGTDEKSSRLVSNPVFSSANIYG